MEIVPVIDIRNGVAVRAVAGRRADYAPLETPLAATSDPCAVARGLMALHPFRALYIADLDAIEGRGVNRAPIAAIARSIAPARLWVDVGLTQARDASRRVDGLDVDAILASETLRSAEDAARGAILSLDFCDAGFRGDPRLLSESSCWPDRLIVMTLARVGARQGPDIARVADIVARAGGRRVYAAGGVRGPADLLALQKAGAAGALVATALHEGRLTPAALELFESR
jgi:phosphoribosylformimino-5-aminoimidazole carboxamide ribotide isomerase